VSEHDPGLSHFQGDRRRGPRRGSPDQRRLIPALSPDIHRQLITSIKAVVGNIGRHTAAPVMLAPMDIRRFMRQDRRARVPDLAVLSYQELSPHVNVQPLDRIKLAMQLAAE